MGSCFKDSMSLKTKPHTEKCINHLNSVRKFNLLNYISPMTST